MMTVRALIEDTCTIIEATNGLTGVEQARAHNPDLILLDISLPDRNGIEVLSQIKKTHPRLAILMLSMHTEHEFAIRALKAGASGYLNKQSAPVQLVTAIRQVAVGRKYISAALAEELANSLGGDTEQPLHEMLSDREFQTLRLIASGKSLSAISDELSLSPKTVSVYRARLLEKLDLRNNSDLTRYAIKNKLVD